MERSLLVGNNKINYTHHLSNRAKRMRITVFRNGKVKVTTPVFLSTNYVQEFILEKSAWIFSRLNFFKQLPSVPRSRYRRSHYLKYKDQAYKLVSEKLEYFNSIYNFKFNRISIRNQKTRWGSCSKKGNLNFNYKIVLLPRPLADYIIVHELCHLKEFNHSVNFWKLVSIAIPDYSNLRRKLKKSSINFV